MPNWRTYEETATYLLDQFASRFGLSHVEGKQNLVGMESGTSWEIDAKGICQDGEGFIIVECRRYTTSKLNQEAIGGLAYRIIDAGAKGGIVISPIGLQEGAKKVAISRNIKSVRLTPESTPFEYVLSFLNEVMVGLSASTAPFCANLHAELKRGG
jgi:hypothetical protein